MDTNTGRSSVEFRLPFFQKCLHTFFMIPGLEAGFECVYFQGAGIRQWLIDARVDDFLCPRNRESTLPAYLFRHLHRSRHELILGDYLIYHPYLQCPASIDDITGKNELLGSSRTYQACGSGQSSPTGYDAENRLG